MKAEYVYEVMRCGAFVLSRALVLVVLGGRLFGGVSD